MSETIAVADLRPGVRYIDSEAGEPVVVEIIGEREPWIDPFGRELFQHLARREDTGAQGYVRFGPGAIDRRLA